MLNKFFLFKKVVTIMLLVFALGLFSVSCGDDDDDGNPFVGTWTSANGNWSIVFTDTHFTETYRWQEWGSTVQSTHVGSYHYSGNTATLQYTSAELNGQATTASVAGNALTLITLFDGPAVFLKQ